MEINLDTADTDEYKNWLALLNELSQIQEVLKNNPNKKGLKVARSHAYNLLADIQLILDQSNGRLQSAAISVSNESEDDSLHLVDRRVGVQA